MGHGAAQDRHVQGAGQLDVVGPVGATVQKVRVLLALDRASECGAGGECLGHLVPPINVAACATDLTML